MAKEKINFRDNLERIDKRFPDKELLQQKECAEYLGCSTDKVRRVYNIRSGGITKVEFARLIS